MHRERGYAPTLHRPPTGTTAEASCASTELSPALRNRLNTLCAIMVANGARINGIEIAYNQLATPDGNVSVLGWRATRHLGKDESLLFVPYSLAISSPVVRRGGDNHLVRRLIDPKRLAVYEAKQRDAATARRAGQRSAWDGGADPKFLG